MSVKFLVHCICLSVYLLLPVLSFIPFVCLFTCMCLLICMAVCLSVCLYLSIFISAFVHQYLDIYSLVRLYFYLPLPVSVFLPINQFVCQYVCLSNINTVDQVSLILMAWLRGALLNTDLICTKKLKLL